MEPANKKLRYLATVTIASDRLKAFVNSGSRYHKLISVLFPHSNRPFLLGTWCFLPELTKAVRLILTAQVATLTYKPSAGATSKT